MIALTVSLTGLSRLWLFNNGVQTPASASEKVAAILFNALVFPLGLLPVRPLHLPSAAGNLLLPFNSLLWGAGIYFLITFFRRKP